MPVPVQIAFVCVQNAGRSQMAYAFAKRLVADRGLSNHVEVVTGGTRPAAVIHEEVVRTMQAVGIDVSDQTPRAITAADLRGSDYVVTMGCSATDVCPASWAGETRDWELADPEGKPATVVDEIRDTIERRVEAFVDELVVAVS